MRDKNQVIIPLNLEIYSSEGNFVFSELTYNKILDILKSNYKWNEQTMFDPPDEHRSIEISWALGSSPMTLKILNNWIVIWSEKEIDINEYEDN